MKKMIRLSGLSCHTVTGSCHLPTCQFVKLLVQIRLFLIHYTKKIILVTKVQSQLKENAVYLINGKRGFF